MNYSDTDRFQSPLRYNYRRGVNREPFYTDEADYNTNAKSYYDYLARYNKFTSDMVDFINHLADEIDWMKENYEALKLSNKDVTYTVGQDGDFVRLNNAFKHIEDLLVQPRKITVILLKDYIMREQLYIINKNYNHITITSEKDIVEADGSRLNDQITVPTNPIFTVKPMFYGENSQFPTIDFKLKNTDKNDQINCGFLMDNTNFIMTKRSGSTYFNFIGLCGVNGSNVTAHYCDFSNNGNRDQLDEGTINQTMYGDGVRIFASSFSANYSIISYNGEIGCHISHGSTAYVDNSEMTHNGHHGIMSTTASQVSARNCKVTDTIDDNVVSYASSNIDLRNSDCSNSRQTFGVIATRSSSINFADGKANNCGRSGIMANRGCSIDATGATADNNMEHGVIASNNSDVDFTSGQANHNKIDGIQATHGSRVQARLSTLENNIRNGILSYVGSVYAQGITITGSGRRGIEATHGGFVSAYECNIDGSKDDNVLAYGGEINVAGGTLTNAGRNGIEATRGGVITADGCKVKTSKNYGVLAYSGKVEISNGSVSGATSEGVYSTRGGEVVAFETSIQSGSTNMHVANGGRIFGSTGHSTNIDANTMTAKGFILLS